MSKGNVTMPAGNKVLVEEVFGLLGLDGFFDGLKRAQGESVSVETRALSANSDAIVGHAAAAAGRALGVGMETVFLDWTNMYFEASKKGLVRIGYSHDKRPDRPQVTVSLAMDWGSELPVGLTVMPANVVDVTHFSETFAQITPFLPDGATMVFDNGPYSRENAATLNEEGLGFVTRVQLNASDDAFMGNDHGPCIATRYSGSSPLVIFRL